MPQLCLPFEIEALVLKEGRTVAQRYDFTRQPWHNGQYAINTHRPPTGSSIQNQPFADLQLYLGPGLHLHFILPDPYFQVRQKSGEVGEDEAFHALSIPTRWWVLKEDKQGNRLKTWIVESNYLHPVGSQSRAVALPVAQQQGKPPYVHVGRQVRLLATDNAPEDADSMSLTAFEANSKKAAHLGDPLHAFMLGDLDYLLYYPNCHSILGFHDPDFDPEKDKSAVYRVFGHYPPEKNGQVMQELTAWAKEQDESLVVPEGSSCCCFGGIEFTPGTDALSLNTKEVAVELSIGHNVSESQLAHLSTNIKGEKHIQDRMQAAEHVEKLDLKSYDRVIDLKRIIHTDRFEKTRSPQLHTVEDEAQKVPETARTLLPQAVKDQLSLLNAAEYAVMRKKLKLDSLRHQLHNDWHHYLDALYPPLAGKKPLIKPDVIRHYLEEQCLPVIEKLDKDLEADEELREVYETELERYLKAYNESKKCQYRLKTKPDTPFYRPQNPTLSIVEKEPGTLYALDEQVSQTVPRMSDRAFNMNGDLTLADHWLWRTPSDLEKWSVRKWSTQVFTPVNLVWSAYLNPKRTERPKSQNLNETFPLKFMHKEYRLEDYLKLQEVAGVEIKLEPYYEKGYYSGYSVLQRPKPEALQQKIDELAVAPDVYQVQDMIDLLKAAKAQLGKTRSLQASLNGFNAACLMGQERLELGIADPLGFDAYQGFVKRVKEAVGHEINFSPMVHAPFNPFREGGLEIRRLALISSFGLTRPLKWNKVSSLAEHGHDGYGFWLRPGLAQAARFRMRALSPWLEPQGLLRWNKEEVPHDFSTGYDRSSSPIFGFIALDALNSGLIVYNGRGQVEGNLNRQGDWRAVGGHDKKNGLEIDNVYLEKWVKRLRDQALFNKFYELLKRYFEDRRAGQREQHEFLKQGNPLALARLSVNLELEGLPALYQNLTHLNTRIQKGQNPEAYAKKDSYTQLWFEVGLGNEMSYKEGLVAIWPEKKQDINQLVEGSDIKQPSTDMPIRFTKTESVFYPQDGRLYNKKHKSIGKVSETRIAMQANGEAFVFDALFDPSQPITLQSGILPDVHWQLPETVYGPVLKRLQPLFFSPYLLTAQQGSLGVPLPVQAQAQWTFLQPGSKGFKAELYQAPTIKNKHIHQLLDRLGISDSDKRKESFRYLVNKGLLVPLISRRKCFSGKDWLPQEHQGFSTERVQGLRDLLLAECQTLGILQQRSAWYFEKPLTKTQAKEKLKELSSPFDSHWHDHILNSLYPEGNEAENYLFKADKVWTDEEVEVLEKWTNREVGQENIPVQGGGAKQAAVLLTRELQKITRQLTTQPDLNARPQALELRDGYLAMNFKD